MGLTVLPPGRQEAASEWSGAAIALREVCEAVGLGNGSTPGSLVATSRAIRAPASIACLGDSITNQCFAEDLSEGPSKPVRGYPGYGYMTWTNIFLGQRLRFGREYEHGVGGDSTELMLARVGDVTSTDAGVCVVHGGTNDRFSMWAASRTIAALTAIYEALRASGILVVAVPIIPRSNWSPLTTEQTTQQRLEAFNVNNWIRRYCIETPGIILADPTAYMVDQASPTADPITGMLADGLHPDVLGAQAMGRAIADAIGPVLAPKSPILHPHNLDAYDPVHNTRGNLIANGSMSGTGGGVVAPVTGIVADAWALQRTLSAETGGTIIASKEPRADGIGGDLQVITFSGLTGTTKVGYTLSTTSAVPAGVVAGDEIEAECEVWVEGASKLNAVMLRAREHDGAAFQSEAYCASSNTKTSYTIGDWSGIMRTPPIALENPASLRIFMDIYLDADGGSGVVKIGRVDLRKVVA